MKLLNALAVALIIPFTIVSCKKGAEEADKGAETDSAPKADTHEAITEEYFGYMEDAMNSMGTIRDKASAEKFIADAQALQPKLEAIQTRAEALPAPTEEQKAAIQATHKEIEARIATKQEEAGKAMQTNPPSPEDMAAMGALLQEFMGGEFGTKMEEITNSVDAVYGLKN
ncbi:MAG: hypothetical protein ACSHYF_05430 [Verrucomicrobiaceae bacterium]